MRNIFSNFVGGRAHGDPFHLPRWVPLGDLICQAMSGWVNLQINIVRSRMTTHSLLQRDKDRQICKRLEILEQKMEK
jgi:hypothetical protein